MMKIYTLFFVAICSTFVSNIAAQENYDDLVKIGDELVLGSPSKVDYRYIHMPRKNFIIKKGGIANMGGLLGNKVIVTKKVYSKDNRIRVTFKRSNGIKFFNTYRTLKADLNGAISHGELRLNDSIAPVKTYK